MTNVADAPPSGRGPTKPPTPAWSIVGLVCLAQFMMVLDVSIVNVALPAMESDLRLSVEGLQWVVNGYILTFAGFLLLGGRAADLYGRRRTFVAGLAVFAIASLAGGLATTPELLIAARAIQGLGAAVVAPATLTILIASIPAGPARARAIATWGAVGAAGGAVGSLAGGLLTDYLSWRWILLINVPIGVVAIIAALRLLAESRDLGTRGLDLTGAITVTLGLSALEFGMLQTPAYGWGAARTLIPMGVGVLALAAFVLVQARFARAPLMPLRVFRARSVSGALLVQFLLGAAGFAVWYFLSLYMQRVLHYSALQAGLAFLPHTLAIIVASKATPRLIGRLGLRPLLAAGALISAAGFAWQAMITPDSGLLTGIVLPGVLVTGGMGLTSAPIAMAAMAGVAPGEAGLVSGILNSSRQIGGSLGLAALTTLAAAHTGAPTSGYALAFGVCAGVVTAGAVAVLALPKTPKVRA
ncbi:MFS transporter [Streptosporangium lutulentum]|uniref:EmrB/QacA subfamily drug resistance transporter n=1 Tax=Streptosporangium lutulentum TaxID=1461250 RepID=A0ABT9QB12_9ACTN|nr:MFS transporter [Streptosporangium lutulentum]MDP9843468.1 EmrB/QacA subfamily drug resistance transporter [Streptosporangium lutulentum]